MANHQPNWSAGMAVICAHRDEKTDAKLAQVRAAIQTMLNDPDVPVSNLNANQLARRPDTPSSWFIREHSGQKSAENGYDHDLAEEIDQAKNRKQHRIQAASADQNTVSASKVRGYMSQIKTLMTQVNDVRATLASERDSHRQTREQLALALGAQREIGTLINPSEHREKLNDIERLNGQVREFNRTLDEVTRGRSEALEEVKALEASSGQLGEALDSCTCQDNVVHLTGVKART